LIEKQCDQQTQYNFDNDRDNDKDQGDLNRIVNFVIRKKTHKILEPDKSIPSSDLHPEKACSDSVEKGKYGEQQDPGSGRQDKEKFYIFARNPECLFDPIACIIPDQTSGDHPDKDGNTGVKRSLYESQDTEKDRNRKSTQRDKPGPVSQQT
jgi:hypothetical protein